MLNKITPAISASGITNKLNQLSTSIGSKVNNSKIAQKALKYTDPDGFNNRFGVLLGLMGTMVIVPRILTAQKRNPDDKEATKDERNEILFRDVQTCAIVLFALKILNSLIASKVGKKSGLPMTNKQFQQIFDSNSKGLQGLKDKACEFIQSPIKKLKRLGKNAVDLVHPTGGVRALNDSEFASKYSGMNSFDEVDKMFAQIDAQGGNSDKVFKNKVLKGLINTAEEKLSKAKSDKNFGINVDVKGVETRLSKLKELSEKENSTECFKNNGASIDESIKEVLDDFFKDPKNMLVTNGRRLSAALRTIAIAIEAIYLGFGLPALNQKRLEKKYLSNAPKTQELNEIQSKDTSTLINKKLDTTEARLFQQFLK